MDGESVYAAGKLGRKRLINHAVTLDAGLSLKGVRHDIDPVVSLPTRPVPVMTLVLVRFINHFEALRRESLGQLFCDEIGGSHFARLGGSGLPVNATNKS